MQPAIKMALRVARQNGDHLHKQFERREMADDRVEAVLKQVSAMESNLYEFTVEQLRRAYRDHYFAPAGDMEAKDHAQSWHILPLVGSGNFIRGLPEFGTLLVQARQGRAENAILLFPVLGEEYAVSRGQGATLNGRRIRASSISHLDQAMLSAGLVNQLPSGASALAWGEMLASLGQSAGGVRDSGQPLLDLARVGAGRLDGALVRVGHPAEILFAGLMAGEAGGLAGDLGGNPLSARSSGCLMSGTRLFRELARLVHPFLPRLEAR